MGDVNLLRGGTYVATTVVAEDLHASHPERDIDDGLDGSLVALVWRCINKREG